MHAQPDNVTLVMWHDLAKARRRKARHAKAKARAKRYRH